MELSYYPGCSLHGTAREYNASARAVCSALEIDLVELQDWSCCGATSGHAVGGELGLALPARNLALAAQEERDLVVPCAACFNRLRAVALAGRHGQLPAGIEPIPRPVEVRSLLGLLSSPELRPRLLARLKQSLAGLCAVTYYGCLLVRPPEVTGEQEIEDPRQMDALLVALGVDVRRWSHKTSCCGGSLTLSRADVVARLVGQLVAGARRSGADCIVTACPMCCANLEGVQFEGRADRTPSEVHLPVFYFTELLGLALGIKAARSWIDMHVLDTRPLLQSRGL